MVKKLICLGMLFLFVFSLAACGQNTELTEYKAAAKTTLETYVSVKGQDNYTAENWSAVRGLAEDGKAAIDEAKDKDGVDTAVKEGLNAIDKIPKKNIALRRGYYSAENNVKRILLYGENQFNLYIVYMDSLPSGTYRIEDGKLILKYSDKFEEIFDIENDRLVYLGAKIRGVFSEAGGYVTVGTVFIMDPADLPLGDYVTEDGRSTVYLREGNQYSFNRHDTTSYRPTGSYIVADGKLKLYIENTEEFVFDIVDGNLVFVSGRLAEGLVEVGTIFYLNED